MSDVDQKILDKIQKLLNLSAKAGTPEEAASAAAKAQELLTAYNLDASLLDRSGSQDGRREDLKLRGGFYEYQATLWHNVAYLNFCMYWTQEHFVKKEVKATGWDGTPTTRIKHLKQKRHRLVGRIVNTKSTQIMAEYLETAIERMLRERLGGDHRQLFSRWAVSFREGAVANIAERLQTRRRQVVREEQERQEKAEAAARAAGRPDSGMGTGLVLSSYIKSEQDANADFLYGEGFSAEQRAKREKAARELAEEEAAYTRWAQANPEEAKRKEAERQKEANKSRGGRGSRGGGYKEKPVDTNAYYSGYDAAKSISIDQQMDSGKQARLK